MDAPARRAASDMPVRRRRRQQQRHPADNRAYFGEEGNRRCSRIGDKVEERQEQQGGVHHQTEPCLKDEKLSRPAISEQTTHRQPDQGDAGAGDRVGLDHGHPRGQLWEIQTPEKQPGREVGQYSREHRQSLIASRRGEQSRG